MRSAIIAIDGPAAAGKTTVGRAVAARLGWALLDTGLLYRALTLIAQERGVAASDTSGLLALVPAVDLRVAPPSAADGRSADVQLGGRDVTLQLHTAKINAEVSVVSGHGAVRAALVEPQRRAVGNQPAVVVGRDIGTVIFPDAALKVYLDASPRERARRRAVERTARGDAATVESELNALRQRDTLDSQREAAPLTAAADAVRLNTDGLTIDEVVARILRLWEGVASSGQMGTAS